MTPAGRAAGGRRATGSRRGPATVLAGALLLVASWLLLAPGSPPLYDGVGFPDEPYRYLQAPAGTAPTKPPTSATSDVAVRGGRTASANISTREQGPQAAVYVADQGLTAPGSAAAVHLTIAPVRPPAQPADGTIPGNAYTITANAGGGPVGVAPVPNAVTVLLRIPKATQATVAVELLVGGRWEQLNTFQTGNDVYSASLPALGTVAAVLVTAPQRSVTFGGAGPAPGHRGGTSWGLLAGGTVLLMLAGLVAGVRVSRVRRGRPARPPRQAAPPR